LQIFALFGRDGSRDVATSIELHLLSPFVLCFGSFENLGLDLNLSLLIDDCWEDLLCSRTIAVGFGVGCLLGREENLFHCHLCCRLRERSVSLFI
jgi:hypothetical protein